MVKEHISMLWAYVKRHEIWSKVTAPLIVLALSAFGGWFTRLGLLYLGGAILSMIHQKTPKVTLAGKRPAGFPLNVRCPHRQRTLLHFLLTAGSRRFRTLMSSPRNGKVRPKADLSAQLNTDVI